MEHRKIPMRLLYPELEIYTQGNQINGEMLENSFDKIFISLLINTKDRKITISSDIKPDKHIHNYQQHIEMEKEIQNLEKTFV